LKSDLIARIDRGDFLREISSGSFSFSFAVIDYGHLTSLEHIVQLETSSSFQRMFGMHVVANSFSIIRIRNKNS